MRALDASRSRSEMATGSVFLLLCGLASPAVASQEEPTDLFRFFRATPPWVAEAPGLGQARFALGFDFFSEHQESLHIVNLEETIRFRDLHNGIEASEFLREDPGLLNRKFDILLELEGIGSELSVPLPGLARFGLYPSLAFQATAANGKLGTDQMEVKLQVQALSMLEVFADRPWFMSFFVLLMLAANVSLIGLGGSLIRHGHQPTLSEVQIFVSYSRKDTEYLKGIGLLEYLERLKTKGIKFWIDKKIRAGRSLEQGDPREGRAVSLGSRPGKPVLSRLGVLQQGNPGFLDHDKALVPVILSPCAWKEHEWVADRQALPGNEETLEEHYQDSGRRHRLFLEIRNALLRHVEEIRQKNQVSLSLLKRTWKLR